MKRACCGVCAVWIAALFGPGRVAHGQSINIDMDAASGAGANTPTLSFGAAAGTPGRWNSVPPAGAGPFSLLLLNSSASTVTISRVGIGSSYTSNNAATTGEYERLLDDIQNIGNPDPNNNTGSTLTINGLAPGEYELYTYAVAPDSRTSRSIVTVTPSPDGPVTVGGTMPANMFSRGVTHALHHFNITSATPSVQVNVKGGPGSAGSLNGLQIKQLKPGRLYVQAGSTGGDGRAWGSAFGDLNAALAQWGSMLGFAGGVDLPEIWISKGTYTPSSVADRSASFVLPAGLRLLGEFRGTSFGQGGERSISQRVFALPATTVLSGEIGDPLVRSDNSWNVVRAGGPVFVEGLTIERGWADGPSAQGRDGGSGLLIDSGSVDLRSVTIRDNVSKRGGAVRVRGTGSISLIDGVVINNDAGVWIGLDMPVFECAGQGGVDVLLERVRVLGNKFGGGGMFDAGGDAQMRNCALAGNVGDGPALRASGQASLQNVTVYANTLGGEAAIVGGRGASGAGSGAVNCVFWRNTDAGGAGIASVAATVAATYCLSPDTLNGVGNNTGRPRLNRPAGADGVIGTIDDSFSAYSGSLAIDSGNGDVVVEDELPKDVLGQARVVNLGGLAATVSKPIDRGGVETQSLVCASDFNSSGSVNVQDLFDFLTSWFSSNRRADVDESGAVQSGDIFEFIALWFAPCP